MADTIVQVNHIYAHEHEVFEQELNRALKRIVENKGVVGDIKYVVDPSTDKNARGGFGALIIYEIPA